MMLYLEDFQVGQTFSTPPASATLDQHSIQHFAQQFDPQPFHTDEQAAQASFFDGLAASGWHTAAITMRLLVECDWQPAGGIIGAGVEQLRWPRPTRPGDQLHIEGRILEVRPLRTRPGQGLIKVQIDTLNQQQQVVQTMQANLVVQARHSAP